MAIRIKIHQNTTNSYFLITFLWHVKIKFSSCQEPEDQVPAYSDDEGLWWRPKRQKM